MSGEQKQKGIGIFSNVSREVGANHAVLWRKTGTGNSIQIKRIFIECLPDGGPSKSIQRIQRGDNKGIAFVLNGYIIYYGK